MIHSPFAVYIHCTPSSPPLASSSPHHLHHLPLPPKSETLQLMHPAYVLDFLGQTCWWQRSRWYSSDARTFDRADLGHNLGGYSSRCTVRSRLLIVWCTLPEVSLAAAVSARNKFVPLPMSLAVILCKMEFPGLYWDPDIYCERSERLITD